MAIQLLDHAHRQAPPAKAAPANDRLVLEDFAFDSTESPLPLNFAGFTDEVMGGRSSATFRRDVVDGRPCIRLAGRVTREGGGGFVQIAVQSRQGPWIDAGDYAGVELLVCGNDQHYNVHVRTADAGWYDQSYRATIFVPSRWQRFRFAWSDFEPHKLDVPLDATRIQRIGLLGWMREFNADVSLGEIALFR